MISKQVYTPEVIQEDLEFGEHLITESMSQERNTNMKTLITLVMRKIQEQIKIEKIFY